MMAQVKTKSIGKGIEYAGVADRLKEFRENNPRAKISTAPTINDNGSVIFQATIIADKGDVNSPEATGTAMYSQKEMSGTKAFEKLETIAVGRALALLGYLNNGEIATSEEMIEFEEYRDSQLFESITSSLSLIENAKTVEELKELFFNIPTKTRTQTQVVEAKNNKYKELTK